ncbi:hypothetical protein C8F04DRAFT_1345221 [Mycena alexandri]|uniref:Uncharacterized protein n=1 Tax=Mycena alexandri TaxID=1745969 RepID=A0AAD6SYE3_9AGAR|nr:hypothetical protein C8F04DRAFT_1345221 [Mycena alexandri]
MYVPSGTMLSQVTLLRKMFPPDEERQGAKLIDINSQIHVLVNTVDNVICGMLPTKYRTDQSTTNNMLWHNKVTALQRQFLVYRAVHASAGGERRKHRVRLQWSGVTTLMWGVLYQPLVSGAGSTSLPSLPPPLPTISPQSCASSTTQAVSRVVMITLGS